MRSRVRGSAARAKERANISYFIFLMFFAIFGAIILTELLLLERPNPSIASRTRFNEDMQIWDSKIEAASAELEQPPPAQEPQDAVWQSVTGTRFRFYVYAAYVEYRTVAAVRVIAATKTRGADKVFCRLWLPDNRTITTKAKVQTIRENWNLRYSATFVLCLLRRSGVTPEETVGATVAVLSSIAPRRTPTNLLIVRDTKPPAKGKENNIHVCVKPFHFAYNRNDWMIEWIELNRLLGVNHFYMYNNTLGETTGCMLDHYRKEGLITILPWKLPVVSVVEIRTEGQFAAFNDCLYRSMSTANWLLVIDADELIIPRQDQNILELLHTLNSSSALRAQSTKPIAAYLFRNAFFYTKWEDDLKATEPLLTARKTRRWATPHVYKNRSKFLVNPAKAVELGNHFLWEHVAGTASIGVPIEHALLHHYRENCEFGGEQCLTVPSTVDRTAHKWSKQLLQKVTEKQALLKTICAKTTNRTTHIKKSKVSKSVNKKPKNTVIVHEHSKDIQTYRL